MSSRRHDRIAGFTLVEVLVSLVVVAVSLAAIGALMASNVRAVTTIEGHLDLVETARVVETALPDRRDLQLGSHIGETAGYRWRIDVLPYADAEAGGGSSSPWIPRTVIIRVASPSGASLQIDTVRLGQKAAR